MKTSAGVFASRADAKRAMRRVQSLGIPRSRIVLLAPGENAAKVPSTDTEQPGTGVAIGSVVGGAAGIAGGLEAGTIAAVIPGVGPVIALGILGATVLSLAGAGLGAAAGGAIEKALSEGLPADEMFVYEDALRHGRTVLLALAETAQGHEAASEAMRWEGAETVDQARKQWWVGLRDAEQEHYNSKGGDFQRDEEFYRMGFEAGLHAHHRCQEYDQVLSEMEIQIDELQRRYPNDRVEEPYRRGYERARDYYQSLCNHKAA